MNAMQEKDWIVRVYRQSSRDKRTGETTSGSRCCSVGRSHYGGGIVWKRAVAKNANGKNRAIRAVPKKGFILLPRIHARISLRKGGKATNEDEDDDDSDHGHGARGASLVPLQRRGDALLVRGHGRSRTLVLRFRCEKDCLEFTDRLAALNCPPLTAAGRHRATTECTRMSGSSHREEDQESQLEQDPSVKEEAEAEQAEEVAAYLARLLCDPELDAFARALEAQIASRPDLQSMLEAKVSTTSD